MSQSKRITADYSALSATDIANLCGVDVRTVSRWANAGCPRNDNGSFPAREVVQWRIDRAAARGEADQRQRLHAAQATKIETENRVRAGELIRMDEAIKGWEVLLVAARQALLGLGHRLAPQLERQPAPVVCRIIDGAIYEILSDLSEGKGIDNLSDLTD